MQISSKKSFRVGCLERKTTSQQNQERKTYRRNLLEVGGVGSAGGSRKEREKDTES